MRRKVLLSLVVCLAVIGFTWHLAAAQLVKYYIHSFCEACFNAGIDAKEVRFDRKTFILSRPHLETVEQLDEGGLRVDVDEVVVNYSLNPWTMTLDVDITIDKPTINFSSQTDIPLIVEKIRQQNSLFNIRPNIIINEGVIVVHECQDLSRQEHVIYVSSSLDFRDRNHGHVAMSFDDPNYDHNSFDIRIRRDDEVAFELEATLNQLDLATITHTVNQLHPTLRQWVVAQGFADGHIVISRKHGKRLKAEGGASLRDLVLVNPDRQFRAQFGSLALEFFGKGAQDKRTLGMLSVGGDSSLSFMQNGYPAWEMKNISGGVRLEKHGNAKLKLVGDCLSREIDFGFQLRGAVCLFDDVQTFLNLSLETTHRDNNNSLLEISVKQINDMWNSAEISMHHFGYREVQFIQEAVTRSYKKWSEYSLYEGVMDGEGIAYFKGSRLHNLKVNHLELRDLVFDHYPYEVYGNVQRIVGSGSVNFSEDDFSKSLNTDFSIENGSLRFVGTDKELWQLSDINTKIAFRNGTIQRSIVHGSFAGLQGTIEVDWLSPRDIMKVNFSGNPLGLNPLLPTRLQRGLQEKFANDLVTFTASVQKLENGFHTEGIIEVQDPLRDTQEDVAFGFDIERLNHHFWQKRRYVDSATQRWHQLSNQAIREVFPALASPLLAVNSHWQKKERGVSGVVVKNGWLFAEEMPLEKYVAPFAFQPDEDDEEEEHLLSLVGRGNFHGAFDNTGLSLSYTAQDVVLDSEDFRMEIESIDQPVEGDGEEKTFAVHHIEFPSGMHFGKIPIKHGTYLDKNTGLSFNEVDTVMKFEGKQIHATNIECFCLGLFFGGDINIDMSPPVKGAFDVEILTHTMSGKISQVQSLFSHFDKPPMFTHFPLEGNVMFRGDGGYLSFGVRPEGTTVKTRLEATLNDGVMSFAPLDLSLYELGMNLNFDQEKNTFVLDNIQGALLVGKPGNVDEYMFSGDQIAFSDFTNNIGAFDLWVGDKKRDILRIVGTTQGSKHAGTSEQWVSFEFDKNLSHFGDVYASNFALTLKDWKDVEVFELDLELQLSTLYGDLKRASRSGLFFFPEELFTQTNNLENAKGDFSIGLKYENDTDYFTFDIIGKDVETGSYGYQNILLNGYLKDSIWSVDQFRIDDISIAAELERQADRWKINFLGLKSGKSLVMGLEGEYLDGANILNAKVNLLEISLEHLQEWSQFEEFVAKNAPYGQLKGTGELRVEKHTNKFLYDGFFSMDARGFQMKGVSFADTSDFSVHFVSDRGLNIRNITTEILPHFEGDIPVGLQVEKMSIGIHNKIKKFEGVRLHIPQKSLEWFADELHRVYPNDISEDTQQIITHIKNTGTVDPTINLLLESNDQFSLKMTLDDDTYQFANMGHEIRDFTLEATPQHLKVKALYRFRQKEFLVNYIESDRNKKGGDVVLTDENSKDGESLVIKWEKHPLYGIYIQEAKGAVGGIQVDMERDWQYSPDNYYSYLLGTAKFSIPKALLFCTDDVMDNCVKQKIGGDVLFDGKIAISKESEFPHKMIGDIESHDFAFKGYLFNQWNAEINYKTDFIRLADMTVKDRSGQISMPEVSLKAMPEGYWLMNVPKVHMKKMRPSLLQEIDKPGQVNPTKPLVFNSIDITSLRGRLGDSSTWLGSGSLKFSNPPKTNLQHTILALPHEIIMRLGLNPAVLTPVTGSIFFDVSDGKIFFNKFKDIYSESKGSKFYLAGGPSSSYVDFDGNLNVSIRMKQYNLLFKLAELFIVSVKGNIQKPVYSLKQERSRTNKKS
jgi:hypothetical protein